MATVTIRNLNDLNKALEGRIEYALKRTQQIIYDCIQESITQYYHEKVFQGGTSSIPAVYERTYKLLNSVIKTDIKKVGNSYQCEVKIDENYLNYKYPGTPGMSSLPATGRDILEWNNADGSHGGTVDGDWQIWNQAMQSLSGENGIISLLKLNLRKAGISIG